MLKLPTYSTQKIAIFRALQLGDILCAIPAIRALRRAYPDAHITFLGLPHTEPIIRRFPFYIDSFIAFPGYPGLPEQPFDPVKFNNFVKNVSGIQFDLIIQMQGNGTVVNKMLEGFGANYLAGFCEKVAEENAFFLSYPNYGHEITRHISLMGHLGVPDAGTALEFPVYADDQLALRSAGLSLAKKTYICVHPGSRGSWRQWPPVYFAAAADFCAARGYQVLLTGTEKETELVKNVAALMKNTPLICAGKTSLGAMALLLKNAFALVANCTGVSHLAAALGIQSVIISMDGEPERWAPLNTQLHRTVDWTKSQDYNVVLKELTALFFRI